MVISLQKQIKFHYRSVIPGVPLTNFIDGGGGEGLTEVPILYPKKSQPQNLSIQKNYYFFWYTPKNPFVLFSQPQKIPQFFSASQNISDVFDRPKKSLLAKISDPKKSLRSSVITICEWGPLYVIERLVDKVGNDRNNSCNFYHKDLGAV